MSAFAPILAFAGPLLPLVAVVLFATSGGKNVKITERSKINSGDEVITQHEGSALELLGRAFDSIRETIRGELIYDPDPAPAPPPANLAPFEYNHLPTPTSIRLLDLRPGEVTDPLVCNISVVDLDDNPKYTALSYSWKRDINWFSKNELENMANLFSSDTFQRRSPAEFLAGRREVATPVQCNGKYRLDVYPNLYDALVQLRKTKPGVYWVDAVCMNQADLQERAHQVQMMGRIYASAKLVVVWLGTVPHPMRPAVKELGKNLPWGTNSDGKMAEKIAGEAIRDRIKRVGGIPPAMLFLLSRRWFQRVWTVQEMLLSKNLVFLCGETEFSSDQVLLLAGISSGHGFKTPWAGTFLAVKGWSELQFGVKSIQSIVPSLSSISHFRSGGRWTLDQWLGACLGRKVTDPRDLAYAGLGLIDPADLKIDQSIKEVEDTPTSRFKLVSGKFSDEYDKLRSKPLWSVLAADYTVSKEEVMLNLAACLLSKPEMNYLSHVGQGSEYISSMWNMPRATLDWLTGIRPSTGPSWHYDPGSLVTRTLPSWKARALLTCSNPNPPFFSGTNNSDFSACTSFSNSPRISANGKELSLLALTLDTVERVWRWADPELPEELLDMLLFLDSSPKTYAHNNNEPFIAAVAHANLASPLHQPTPDTTASRFLLFLQAIVTHVTSDLVNSKKVSEHAAHRTRLGLPTTPRHKAFLSLSPDQQSTHLWTLLSSIQSTHDNIAPLPGPLPETWHSTRTEAYQPREDTHWRTFFVTTSGMVGLGPISLGLGDKICLVPGAYTPYAFATPKAMYERDRELERGAWRGRWGAKMVSRGLAWVGKSGGDGMVPWRKGGRWKGKKEDGLVLLGETYVRGWMDGNKVEGLVKERRGWERICIV